MDRYNRYTYIFLLTIIKNLQYKDSATKHFNGDHPGSLEIVSFFCWILDFNSLDFLTLSSSFDINCIKLCNLH